MGHCPERATAIAVEIIRIRGDEAEKGRDDVVEEAPLTIRVNGEDFSTLLHSAGEEENLVRGFLAAEGVIGRIAEIERLTVDYNQGIAEVTLCADVAWSGPRGRRTYISACCGRGRQGFYFDEDLVLARVNFQVEQRYKVSQLRQYLDRLEEVSELFAATGGVHNGMLCLQGQVLHHSNDVGRHNVLDKLYGWALEQDIALMDTVLVFSGRISAELVIKLIRMQVVILVAKSAPSSLAIDMAETMGITLIGFARGTKMNIYTHPSRVILD